MLLMDEPELYARKALRSSPGQLSMFTGLEHTGTAADFREDLHPRDDDGKFRPKGVAKAGQGPTVEESPTGQRKRTMKSSAGQMPLPLGDEDVAEAKRLIQQMRGEAGPRAPLAEGEKPFSLKSGKPEPVKPTGNSVQKPLFGEDKPKLPAAEPPRSVAKPVQKPLFGEGAEKPKQADSKEPEQQPAKTTAPEPDFSLSTKPKHTPAKIEGMGKAKQVDLFAGRGDSPGQTSFFDDIDPAAKNVGAMEKKSPVPATQKEAVNKSTIILGGGKVHVAATPERREMLSKVMGAKGRSEVESLIGKDAAERWYRWRIGGSEPWTSLVNAMQWQKHDTPEQAAEEERQATEAAKAEQLEATTNDDSRWMQQSGIPKPDAPQEVRNRWTHKDLTRRLAESREAQAKLEESLKDWQSRSYKPNNSRIDKADMFGQDAGSSTVGAANERRKAGTIRSLQDQIAEHKANQKSYEKQLSGLQSAVGVNPDNDKALADAAESGSDGGYLDFLLGKSSQPDAKPADPHAELIERASKYAEYGDNYNRHIATALNDLLSVKERGHGQAMQDRMAETLRQRLEHWVKPTTQPAGVDIDALAKSAAESGENAWTHAKAAGHNPIKDWTPAQRTEFAQAFEKHREAAKPEPPQPSEGRAKAMAAQKERDEAGTNVKHSPAMQEAIKQASEKLGIAPKPDESAEWARGVRAAKDMGGQVPQKAVNEADKILQKSGEAPMEKKVGKITVSDLEEAYSKRRPVSGDRWITPKGEYVEIGKTTKTPSGSFEVEYHFVGKNGGRTRAFYVGNPEWGDANASAGAGNATEAPAPRPLDDKIASSGGLIAKIGKQMGVKPQDMEDFISDVQLKAIQGQGGYDASKGEFSTWLGTIARNHKMTQQTRARAAKRAGVTQSLATPNESGKGSLADTVAAKETARESGDAIDLEKIRGVMGQLPDKQRQAFEAVVTGGKSVTEAAEEMGISKQAVSAYINLAKVKIKAAVGVEEDKPAESPPQPQKPAQTLAEKVAAQRAAGKKAASPKAKPKPKTMVSMSGGNYELVKENDDGTVTVKNDQGDEFTSDPGEDYQVDGREKMATKANPEASKPPFSPEQAIKIAANSVRELRKQDVYRVLDSNPAEHMDAIADHVKKNRPELASEVDSALSDIHEERGAAAKPPQAASAPTPPSEPPAKSGPPGVSHDDIPFQVAYNAHAGISHVPEKRAKQRQAEYVAQMTADWDHLSKLAKTPEQKEALAAEFERYRTGFRDKTLAVLHAGSRVMSPMITGPARFPTASNRKRGDTYDKRIGELLEFRKRALSAITKKLSPESGPVKSSDSNAVETLQKQLDAAQKYQDAAKEVNKIVRSHVASAERDGGPVTFKPGKTRESAIEAIKALGLSEKTASEALKGDYMGRVGIPDYSLKNNNANMRRIKQRIEELSKMKATPAKSEEYSGGVEVHEDPEAARIRIKFPGKPERDAIDKLKRAGFRWSPTEGAWQRHLNNAGRYAVNDVLKSLGHTKQEAAAPQSPPVSDDVPEMLPMSDQDDAEPQTESVATEQSPGSSLTGWHKDEFTGLHDAMKRQLTGEGPRRQESLARSLMESSPPAVQKELFRALKSIAPEAHAAIAAKPGIHLHKETFQ